MTFAVETSDVADAEMQAAFLRLAARDPEFAGRWMEGLLRAVEGLNEMRGSSLHKWRGRIARRPSPGDKSL